jgi:hypothetical protein
MSIRFACEKCGHPIEVDQHFEGKHGKCKHCGHALTVPAEHHAPPSPHAHSEPRGDALHLKPLEEEEPLRVNKDLLATHAPLSVRPAEEDPRVKPEAVTAPDEEPLRRTHWMGSKKGAGTEDYRVIDTYKNHPHSSAGPPPFWVNAPTLAARFFASRFRTLRDWLYVASVASLILVFYGYIFQSRSVMHFGAIACITANISMLCVGVAYLVSLPFKESLFQGLANLFIPFYALYYWSTRWHKMRRPVYKTLGSFVPILLVGLAYAVYKEADVIKDQAGKFEKQFENLDKSLPPVGSDDTAPAKGKPAEDESP